MKLSENTKQRLENLSELAKYYAPIIAMFIFFYHANEKTSSRLDSTIAMFQHSIDEVHKRSDVLHQEFIDLIKDRNSK